MTAVVNAALDLVASTWASLTPLSRTESPYHLLEVDEDDPEVRDDVAADRGFYFTVGPRVPLEETDGSITLCEWSCQAVLLLSVTEIGRQNLRNVLANEINHLTRAAEALTIFPSGVQEILIGTAAPDGIDEEAALAQASIELFVLAEESQS